MVSLLWRKITRFVALPILLGGLLLALPAMAGSVEATLDQNTISLGDTATLSITISDGSVTAEPVIPPLTGMTLQSTGEQTEMNFDGQHMLRKTIYTFELSPSGVGSFTIPAIQVGVSGQTLSTKPLVLTVAKGRVAAAPGSGPAFVEISLPKTNMFFGELLRVEVRCYFQNASQMQQPNLEAGDFSVSPIFNPKNVQSPPREMVGGVPYFMYTFPVAINATKTGPLTLGPVSWELNVPTGERTFFGRAQQHIRVSGDAVTINVLPVPVTPDVQGFNGAVGNFSLAEFDASPTTVGAGDPITLKVRIAGRGGFDNVVLPTNQPGWNDFKLYQPTAKFDTTDPLQIEGSKYFEQVVTPQNASVKEIPPFQFTFFDPDQQKFRTLTHGPIPITVHAVAATPQPTVISTGAPPPPEEQQTREIVHIKPFLGRAVSDAPPLIKQPWFLALQAVPPLAWLAALIWRRRKDSLANNPRLRRQRQVARVVQEGLADLARLAGSRDYDGFYSTVFRLLQEQLGERLDLPASAITEAALEDLPHHGLDANAIRNLQELFQACNQYRYTPEHTAQEMNSVAAKLKDALAALQQMKARHGHAKAVARSLACLLFLVFTTSLRAQSPAEAFSQGNKLYEQAKYPDAEAAYQKIIDSGTRSVALWFNLGNAAFKAGHIGRAIEAFRRAEILDPHDPDVRANLHFARDQVANFAPALPGGHWTRWVNRLTLDQWAIASSVALALFFFSLLARQLRPNLRQSGWSTPLLLAAASVCLTICLGLAINQRLLQKSAVVIVGETAARRGPLDEAETAFTLHDGSEILIADQNGPWIEVADAADHTGWVPQKDLAFIP